MDENATKLVNEGPSSDLVEVLASALFRSEERQDPSGETWEGLSEQQRELYRNNIHAVMFELRRFVSPPRPDGGRA